jgi:hypothetical protein
MLAEIQVYGTDIKKENRFSLMGSVVSDTGGAEEDVKIWISKENGGFTQFCLLIWKARKIGVVTKLTIFRRDV